MDGVTPESPQRNPFFSIAALVAVLAVAAALAGRYGVNNAVAALCVVAAVLGTWFLLSPQIDVLESMPQAPAGGTQDDVTHGVSAFTTTEPVIDTNGRQQLRSTPRMAVGFDGEEQTPARVSVPAASGAAAHADPPPVRALGQLPQDARGIHIETTVEPASNISGAYTLGKFEIRAASRRGSDHVILNDPRQDDVLIASAAGGRYLIAIVADGEGAAEFSHYGSYWSCRLLAQAIDQHLREGVPGIENMLSRTRDDLGQLFDLRFTDGTKLRTIATTLAGVIAPVDGGPGAAFRVGSADIFGPAETGWASVFSQKPSADDVFPRTIDAEVVPLEFDANCLLLASDGVAAPLVNSAKIAESFREGLGEPTGEVEFDQLLTFPLEDARGDRTAAAIWFRES